MSENSEKKFGLLLKWPKPFRNRLPAQPTQPHRYHPQEDDDPPEAAIVKVFQRAHLQTIEQAEHDRKLSRNRVIIIVASIIGLALLTFSYIADLHERITAPDRVIKTHEAQQRIIYGPLYEGLKTRHPDQTVIPPMDQWAPQQHKE